MTHFMWLVLYDSYSISDSPCLRRTSGAIYSGVPQNVYRFSPGGVLLANPKSDNLGYPFASFHVQLHPTHDESATTLVTDVGDRLFWWQHITDKCVFFVLKTSSTKWFSHQHLKTVVILKSPRWSCHQHHCNQVSYSSRDHDFWIWYFWRTFPMRIFSGFISR